MKKVQEKKVPDLDDNFAKETFGIETISDLRDRIRGQLEGEEERRVRREMEEQMVEELLKINTIPIPEQLAERLTADAIGRSGGQVDQLPEEQREQIQKGYREAVERRIAREWLLDSIGRQESIEVDNQEVGEEMSKLASAQGRIGSEFRSLSPQERQTKIHDALLEKKIFDYLIEAAKVEEEKITESQPTVAT